MDSSPPHSSVYGISQARILQWVAISFSRGSSQHRNRTWVSPTAGKPYCLSRQVLLWREKCSAFDGSLEIYAIEYLNFCDHFDVENLDFTEKGRRFHGINNNPGGIRQHSNSPGRQVPSHHQNPRLRHFGSEPPAHLSFFPLFELHWEPSAIKVHSIRAACDKDV